MKILIIGATGPTGQQLVQQAIAEGHEVTALARNPAKVEGRDRLTVVPGDVLNPDSLTAAVQNQEAVICSLGTKLSRKPTTMLSEGTKNIVNAMEKQGVRRFVCITGIGAGDSQGHGGFVYDKLILPLLLKNIYKDKTRQEGVIRQSQLDWIVVRPAQLTDTPMTGQYQVWTDLTGKTAGKISRADVADFVLQQLTSDRYLHQTPLISY
jgi:putative NADH-flavin reductase